VRDTQAPRRRPRCARGWPRRRTRDPAPSPLTPSPPRSPRPSAPTTYHHPSSSVPLPLRCPHHAHEDPYYPLPPLSGWVIMRRVASGQRKPTPTQSKVSSPSLSRVRCTVTAHSDASAGISQDRRRSLRWHQRALCPMQSHPALLPPASGSCGNDGRSSLPRAKRRSRSCRPHPLLRCVPPLPGLYYRAPRLLSCPAG
jgi:hypothetical protein